MSNELLTKEIDSLLKSQKFDYPLNAAMCAAMIMSYFKGSHLRLLDTSALSSITDYNLLCSCSNTTQAKSLADEIYSQLKRNQIFCLSFEGHESADWILLDFAGVIVHIFLEETRPLYDLDNLWLKASQVQIPPEFYSTQNESQTPKLTGKAEDYF